MTDRPEQFEGSAVERELKQVMLDDRLVELCTKSAVILFGCTVASDMFAQGVNVKNFGGGAVLGAFYALIDKVYKDREVN